MKKDRTWKLKIERIRRSQLWAGDMAKIAVRILDFLEDNNKTQKWLAEQLEVSPQQITKIVKGRQNLSWGKIKEIENVLGIRLAIIKERECDSFPETPRYVRVTLDQWTMKPKYKPNSNYQNTIANTIPIDYSIPSTAITVDGIPKKKGDLYPGKQILKPKRIKDEQC